MPVLDVVKGTNIVHKDPRDSSTVYWIIPRPTHRDIRRMPAMYALILARSPDIIDRSGETGPTGDRSTFFHNPFRRGATRRVSINWRHASPARTVSALRGRRLCRRD
jgi:hypothetical protein